MRRGELTEEHKAKLAEGRRKAAEAKKAAKEAGEGLPAVGGTAKVIYRPFDGEPHTCKWNGITFRANVPVTLDRANPAHSYEQLLPRHTSGPNGEVLTKHVPTMMFMGDIARTNPAFEVDGHQVKRLVNSRVVPPAGQEWTDAHEGQISESHQLDNAV